MSESFTSHKPKGPNSRGAVSQCTHDELLPPGGRTHPLSTAKVSEYDSPAIFPECDENIFGLDVAVYDILLVEVVQGKQKLVDNERGHFILHLPVLVSDEGLQIASRSKLRQEVAAKQLAWVFEIVVVSGILHRVVRSEGPLNTDDVWLVGYQQNA